MIWFGQKQCPPTIQLFDMKWYDIIILFYVIVDKIQDVVIMAYDYDDDDDDDYPVKWSRNGMEWHDMIWYDMEWQYDMMTIQWIPMACYYDDMIQWIPMAGYYIWNGMEWSNDMIRYDTIWWLSSEMNQR